MARTLASIFGPTECCLGAVVLIAATWAPPEGRVVSLNFGMLLLGWIAARGWATFLLPASVDPPVRVLAIFVVGYSLIVWSQILASSLGAFHARIQWIFWSLFAASGLIAGILARPSRYPQPPAAQPSAPRRIVEWLIAMGLVVAFIPVACRLVRRWLQPPLEWDAWAYHLYFPLRWIQDGRIDYVAKPFGPEFITYFPCNFECLVTWLYWPAMSEWLPKTAGAIFVVWGAVALFCWSRLLGSEMLGSAIVAAAWILSPVIGESGTGTGNDIAGGACFLTAMVFAEWARREVGNWALVLAGLSAGHFIGEKYPNVVYLPILVLHVVATLATAQTEYAANTSLVRLASRFATWSALVVLGGGFWYLKNWFSTGNPIYPARVSFLGVEIFGGPIPREAMYTGGWTEPDRSIAGFWRVATEYYSTRLPPIVLFGEHWSIEITAILVVAGLIGFVLLAAQTRRWSIANWATLATPIIGFLLFWELIPYTSHIRYAMPAIIMSFAWLSFPSSVIGGNLRLGLLAVECLLFIGIAWPQVSFWAQTLVVGNTITVLGLTAIWVVCLGSIVTFCDRVLLLSPWRRGAIAGVATAALLLGSTPQDLRRQLLDPSAQRSILARFGGNSWDHEVSLAWLAIDSLTSRKPATIAYAGMNIPYMLYGSRFHNRIVDIAPNDHQGWQLHQYVESLTKDENARLVSRERIPAYRVNLDRSAWEKNLADQKVDFVFLMTVHPGERHAFTREMDADAFSVERRWCDELGFTIVASGKEFRIYKTSRMAK